MAAHSVSYENSPFKRLEKEEWLLEKYDDDNDFLNKKDRGNFFDFLKDGNEGFGKFLISNNSIKDLSEKTTRNHFTKKTAIQIHQIKEFFKMYVEFEIKKTNKEIEIEIGTMKNDCLFKKALYRENQKYMWLPVQDDHDLKEKAEKIVHLHNRIQEISGNEHKYNLIDNFHVTLFKSTQLSHQERSQRGSDALAKAVDDITRESNKLISRGDNIVCLDEQVKVISIPSERKQFIIIPVTLPNSLSNVMGFYRHPKKGRCNPDHCCFNSAVDGSSGNTHITIGSFTY